MSSIRIFDESEFVTSEWSGGTTTQLYIDEGGSYAERRFRVRISTATVDIEESVFTRLEGVRRFLTPLCAGFELTVNNADMKLARGEVLEFSGDDDVTCRGSGRDLNLMLKDAEGRMFIADGNVDVSGYEYAFVFAPEELFIEDADSGEGIKLAVFSFARLRSGKYILSRPAVLFVANVTLDI
ncbi:MAG: HutD family protein [Clostridia bacterium]|nr:HutD family protein [Clostridia bacterium]